MSSELRVSGAYVTDISAAVESAVTPLNTAPPRTAATGSSAVTAAVETSASLQAALALAVSGALTDATGGARAFLVSLDEADRSLAATVIHR